RGRIAGGAGEDEHDGHRRPQHGERGQNPGGDRPEQAPTAGGLLGALVVSARRRGGAGVLLRAPVGSGAAGGGRGGAVGRHRAVSMARVPFTLGLHSISPLVAKSRWDWYRKRKAASSCSQCCISVNVASRVS